MKCMNELNTECMKSSKYSTTMKSNKTSFWFRQNTSKHFQWHFCCQQASLIINQVYIYPRKRTKCIWFLLEFTETWNYDQHIDNQFCVPCGQCWLESYWNVDLILSLSKIRSKSSVSLSYKLPLHRRRQSIEILPINLTERDPPPSPLSIRR